MNADPAAAEWMLNVPPQLVIYVALIALLAFAAGVILCLLIYHLCKLGAVVKRNREYNRARAAKNAIDAARETASVVEREAARIRRDKIASERRYPMGTN